MGMCKSPQVAELLAGVAAPILYWEQGHEWLFGDPVRFQARSRQKFYPGSVSRSWMQILLDAAFQV